MSIWTGPVIGEPDHINNRSGKIHNNSPAGWAIVAGSDRVFDLLLDHGAAKLDWFSDDAQAAVNGAFAQFKVVPHASYERIQTRLNS